MTGHEKPDDGSAALVGQNVVMSYFEQNQADVSRIAVNNETWMKEWLSAYEIYGAIRIAGARSQQNGNWDNSGCK